MKEFMFFQVGHSRFCLELSFIKSVYRISDISETLEKETREQQDFFICIIDGRQIPLYDFSIIFDIKQSDYDPEFHKVIRIELGNNILALRVDHVDGVAEIMENLITPLPPAVKGKTLEWFPHVLQYEGDLVPVLNPWGMAGIKLEQDDDKNNINDKLDFFFSNMINQEHLVNIFTISLKHVLGKILTREFKNMKTLLGKHEQ